MKTAPYEVIEQKEVIHECMAGFLADIRRTMDEQGIPADAGKPLAVLYRKASVVFHEIYGAKYTTMEEVEALRREVEALSACGKKLEKNYA